MPFGNKREINDVMLLLVQGKKFRNCITYSFYQSVKRTGFQYKPRYIFACCNPDSSFVIPGEINSAAHSTPLIFFFSIRHF